MAAKPDPALFPNLDPKKSAGGGGVVPTVSTKAVIEEGGAKVIPTPVVDTDSQEYQREVAALEASITALQAQLDADADARKPEDDSEAWARAALLLSKLMEQPVPRSPGRFEAWLAGDGSARALLAREAPQLAEALGVAPDETDLPMPLVEMLASKAARVPSAELGRRLMNENPSIDDLVSLAPELEPSIRKSVQLYQDDQADKMRDGIERMRVVGAQGREATQKAAAAVGPPMPAAMALKRRNAEKALIRKARQSGAL